VMAVKALMAPSTAAIRDKACSVTSKAEISPEAMALARGAAACSASDELEVVMEGFLGGRSVGPGYVPGFRA